MGTNITTIDNPIFNREGNIVIEEKTDGRGRTQTVKYGIIRIIGDKNEHRVSMKTLLDINAAKKANFDGQLNIPDLAMSINASQIVMMRSETEEIREDSDFTKLPTEVVMLDKDFNRLTGTRPQIERENDIYYIATCHYVVRDGGKQYYLEPHQIQYLVTMARDEDPDYPHYIKQALRYGRDVREIKKEQAEKKRR